MTAFDFKPVEAPCSRYHPLFDSICERANRVAHSFQDKLQWWCLNRGDHSSESFEDLSFDVSVGKVEQFPLHLGKGAYWSIAFWKSSGGTPRGREKCG